ncbi:MMPL family transporter [Telmatocola sphagniphila]|uniref:MMPL family transporter n=1 Tax=Telmatocola sphagniphila TaxID=1123043 RepID=A0A8E6EU04_9BACT|nr:MMPL family transporter [Telmatocola sphagniphila]QVL30637.1 MMPL family transporter [Telmatocola sphagniphila]
MFHFLGQKAGRHPWKILSIWLLVAIGLKVVAPDWQKNATDDDVSFMPASAPSVRAFHLLELAFPKDVAASRAIVTFEREDSSELQPEEFRYVDTVITQLRKLQSTDSALGITQIASYKEGPIGARLISNDKKCVLVPISLATPYLAHQTRVALNRVEDELRESETASPKSNLRWTISGAAGVGRDLVNAGGKSLDRTTFATIGLVVVVLLAVYRSPWLAMVPLVTIGFAVFVALQLLAILTLIPGVQLVNISQVFAIVILFGAGTDYCLFLISRYREELEYGQTPQGGLPRAMRAVTGAIVGSAGTVICGLGMMGFAEFGKIRCAGPVIALGLLVGLMAALTITPALLAIGKRSVFWPMRVRLMSPSKLESTFWQRASRFVVAKPGWVFGISLLILMPLVILGTQIRPSFKPTGDLSPNALSVKGMGVIQRHFTAGETGPITVLLTSPRNWNEPEGRNLIQRLSFGFANLENVAEVRSLTQPLGKPLEESPKANPFLSRFQEGIDSLTQLAAVEHYVARIGEESESEYVTRLDVVLKADPFEPESIRSLNQLESWIQNLLPGQSESFRTTRAECYGVTINARDMANVISRDRLVVNSLVITGVFLILLILVRRIWLATYLLGTVLLSYYATLGATALFGMWLTGRSFGLIEWRVPFFLFTILVAIGEDYNILLVSRILQERRRYGLVEGVQRGLAKTGGTITACGVIMAGTFGTLMLADLSTLKQVGFALAFGVMLDTFVVRPFLVPAFLLLVWNEPEPIQVRKTQIHARFVSSEAISLRRVA